ncbi:5-hydroxytryptamine receptor 3B [Spea bombifrons]|uniref:5-hydroxytryptamine receptor 3B n=1 Tax=Spea bombifrons TaxID=233779 RepID=UPI00234C0325|nr:5-hydroxytryptamine receptor 3B [Spea bombifrons]
MEEKLSEMKNNELSIQTVSLWLIHHRRHSEAIIFVWDTELGKAETKRKLTSIHLANNVIQNRKRKGPESCHRGCLKHASSELDATYKKQLDGVLSVWEERATLLLTVTLPGPSSADLPQTKNSALHQLTKHLLINYHKGVRPVKNWSEATTVYIDLFIHAVLDVDGQNQKLTTSIWYRQIWKDDFLAWNSTHFDGIEEISLPLNAIWVPDIVINEFIEEEKAPDLPYVYVSSVGTIRNYKPLQVVSACNLETYAFPFDIQNCSLTFSSCLHTVNDLNLSIWRSYEEISEDKSIFLNDGEWELLEVPSSYEILHTHGGSFAQVKFNLVIRRRPLLYIVSILMPSILLMTVDLMSFYLPPNSGTRIMFKTSILVGYTVFRVNMADELPATTLRVPLIGVFFVVCMALMVLSLGKSIVVIKFLHLDKEEAGGLLESRCPLVTKENFDHKKDNTEDTSLGSINETSAHIEFPGPTVSADPLMEKILEEVTSIRSYMEEMESEELWHTRWLRLCYKLDSLLFRSYLILFTAYAATLTLLWWTWSSYGTPS